VGGCNLVPLYFVSHSRDSSALPVNLSRLVLTRTRPTWINRASTSINAHPGAPHSPSFSILCAPLWSSQFSHAAESPSRRSPSPQTHRHVRECSLAVDGSKGNTCPPRPRVSSRASCDTCKTRQRILSLRAFSIICHSQELLDVRLSK